MMPFTDYLAMVMHLGDNKMTQALKARPPTHKRSRHTPPVRRSAETNDLTASRHERVAKPPVPVTREVLVPLDGTASAEHALPWAIRIAESTGAQVRAVYVH